MVCDKCGIYTTDGVGANYVGYSKKEDYHWAGRDIEYFGFTPFSVWFCRECIRQQKKKLPESLGCAMIAIILYTIATFFVDNEDIVFLLWIGILAFGYWALYALWISIKVTKMMGPSDLENIFPEEIKTARTYKALCGHHMTVSEFQKMKKSMR